MQGLDSKKVGLSWKVTENIENDWMEQVPCGVYLWVKVNFEVFPP